MENKKLFPNRVKTRKMTDKEITQWKEFKKDSSLESLHEHIDYVCKLYSEVFNTLYFKPDQHAYIMPVMKMIDNIDILVNSYGK